VEPVEQNTNLLWINFNALLSASAVPNRYKKNMQVNSTAKRFNEEPFYARPA